MKILMHCKFGLKTSIHAHPRKHVIRHTDC